MTKATGAEGNLSAEYHDAHIDDPNEWDDSGVPEIVIPQPSGMTVFSLRLPAAELATLKAEADARRTTVSELTRAALRSYLAPRATGTLSAHAVHGLQVSTPMPVWTGGFNDRRLDVGDVRLDPAAPQPLPGNVEPASR